jgi:hypothetical protein
MWDLGVKALAKKAGAFIFILSRKYFKTGVFAHRRTVFLHIRKITSL